MEDKKEPKPTNNDCLSCRLIGGSSMLFCSLYVFSVAYRSKSRMTKITSGLFGSSLGYIGISRFLNIFPFGQEDTNISVVKEDV
ncbi:hypothetical protein AVEN_64503-1 [Araneus ventricosus]|uniref:Distal membrane-arm assembly complex protein 1-like domain-containing protein n=1 Tax=Araneus ventricosus TaxID=182803 RepID=A0A4Y2PNI3_ARAVE|nr:hypothetical protein AVEN_180025-1 [Araneus ventricosus]GBN53495.1 hypothetical protein AVEN_127245-1 [Araneus ventricosus]GBN54300.1 hypothetical protein AVEN_64503-1 [Araneus ventricosus]